MQDLIIYNDNEVIVQCDNKTYQDKKDNFLLDYGKQVSYESIDYNRDTKCCWLNGEAFQEYPNELCEDILYSIDTLLAKKKEREYVAPTFDELKIQKLADVDTWTAEKITGGFISSASGEPVKYDSDKDTQLTMQGIALNVNTALFAEKYPTGCPVRGYADGASEKSVFMLTAEQVLQWCADLSIHIGTCKQEGWAKQNLVNKATTKEELDLIEL